MSHTCGIGIIEIPKPQTLPTTDIADVRDKFALQLNTYNELLEIQNEQLRTRDVEITRLREELHNVVSTRELERNMTTTQDSFTYLLLQRENTKLNEKVKALEELAEKMKAEYERRGHSHSDSFPRTPLDERRGQLDDQLAPPKLIRQDAIIERIAENNTKIKVLKKKMKSQSKKEAQEKKLQRMSQGKPSV